MNDWQLRVAIIGPYPPRIGGISVHVQRLQSLLAGANDIWVFDPYGSVPDVCAPKIVACGPLGLFSAIKLIFGVRRLNPDIIHLHVASMRSLVRGGVVLLKCLPRRKGRVLTIHTGDFVTDYQRSSRAIQSRMRDLIRWFDVVIAVSDEIAEVVRSLAILDQHVSVLPAYIPPVGLSVGEVPAWLTRYRSDGRKILVCAGYGIPSYGFDCLLDAVACDQSLQADCCVVLCLYGDCDEAYVRELRKRASAMPAATVVQDLMPSEFASILAVGDIFIRPTHSDGDAVAVREAGYFGMQVIASDCVKRPQGVELFGTGNAQELNMAIGRAMQDSQFGLLSETQDVSDRQYERLYGLARSTSRQRG